MTPNDMITRPHQRRVQLPPEYRPRHRAAGCLVRAGIATLGMMVLCAVSLVAAILLPIPQLDVLVLGLDANPGEGYTTRADAILIVSGQTRPLRTNLLSVPRDLYFDVPGYGLQRINTVNVLGEQEARGRGVSLTAAAIEQELGIRIDRHIRLNFQGFVELIDAIGGVTIDIERRVFDTNYPTGDGGVKTVVFEVGREHMNGERALIYARTRQADDDYFRAARQQQIVNAVLARMTNPLNWLPALAALNRHVETNLSPLDMIRLAPPALLGARDQLVIDRERIRPTPGGSGVRPDPARLESWIRERFD